MNIRVGVRFGWGHGRCERRSFCESQKKRGGGGSGWRVSVVVNKELKFCVNSKTFFFFGGGGGSGRGGGGVGSG